MPKVSRFAHLLGLRAMAEDEDNRDENTEEEDDDKKAKKAKGRKAEDEKDDPDADNDADDPDSENDDDDPDASEDDEDDEDDEGDEDGDDDKDAKVVKQGRRAERRRCARIFGSQHAADNPALAAALAFETGMCSAQAIKVMSSGGIVVQPAAKSSRVSLDERMASVKTIQLGRDEKPAAPGSAKGRASIMTSLYNRAKGVK